MCTYIYIFQGFKDEVDVRGWYNDTVLIGNYDRALVNVIGGEGQDGPALKRVNTISRLLAHNRTKHGNFSRRR